MTITKTVLFGFGAAVIFVTSAIGGGESDFDYWTNGEINPWLLPTLFVVLLIYGFSKL